MSSVLHDLLVDRATPVAEAVDRHFAPGYRQRTDGVWTDRAEFTEHVTQLREITTAVEFEIHEELHAGTAYADRHAVRVTKLDGTVLRVEVYAFGELDDTGRFVRIDEVTRLAEGPDADRHIGNAR